MTPKEIISTHMSKIGSKGGKSTSPKKLAALAKNRKKRHKKPRTKQPSPKAV